jgi:hypothetical protein
MQVLLLRPVPRNERFGAGMSNDGAVSTPAWRTVRRSSSKRPAAVPSA